MDEHFYEVKYVTITLKLINYNIHTSISSVTRRITLVLAFLNTAPSRIEDKIIGEI